MRDSGIGQGREYSQMNNTFAFKGKEAPWRRENASEETVLIGTRVIIIFQRTDESGLDVQNKLNRFRAGEDVEDVHAGPPGNVDQIKASDSVSGGYVNSAVGRKTERIAVDPK